MSIQDDNIVTHYPAGIASHFIDDQAVEKTADYTVVKDTDVGKTFYQKSAITFTLPSIAAGALGQVYKFVNLAPDGTAMTISPNALDGIAFKSAADADKDVINTAATAKKGDYIVISNTIASADHWVVMDVRGTWAKEA
jgi:hypothetical protein